MLEWNEQGASFFYSHCTFGPDQLGFAVVIPERLIFSGPHDHNIAWKPIWLSACNDPVLSVHYLVSAYLVYVFPHLEYRPNKVVWSPYLQRDIEVTEKV